MRLIGRSFGSVEGMLTVHPLQHRHNAALCADQTWPSKSVVNLDHAVLTRPQAVIANRTRTARRQDSNDAVAVLFAQRIRIMLHHSTPPASLTSSMPLTGWHSSGLTTAEPDDPPFNRFLACSTRSPINLTG